jgi:hypothetical protein
LHQTLGTKLNEIRGEIEENWKVNGQLRVNLHKSKTNDQNKRVVGIWGWHWSLVGTKSHKIESLWSIKGAIERNEKMEDQIELWSTLKLKP